MCGILAALSAASDVGAGGGLKDRRRTGRLVFCPPGALSAGWRSHSGNQIASKLDWSLLVTNLTYCRELALDYKRLRRNEKCAEGGLRGVQVDSWFRTLRGSVCP